MATHPSSTPHGVSRLTFGMVPAAADEDTRLYLSDFCTRLGRALDTTVLPHRAPSPAALASAIHSGRVHIAWLSPTLLADSPLVADAVPAVCSVREGVAAYHAALFVPEASAVRAPEQLRGTRVAWVARSSAAGYVFPRVALARRGLDPRSLFAGERFYDSHPAVAQAVFSGEADVGATFAVFRHGDPGGELVNAGFSGAGGAARVIDVAGPIPSDVVATAASVPLALRARLRVAMMDLAQHVDGRAALRHLFRVDGFEPCAPAALAELRALIAAGRSLGVLAAE